MISDTPYYIILGKFGIAILLAVLAKQIERGNWTTVLWAGAVRGVGIFVCYAIAYVLIDCIFPR